MNFLLWYRKTFPFLSSNLGIMLIAGLGFADIVAWQDWKCLLCFAVLFYMGTASYMFDSWAKDQHINYLKSKIDSLTKNSR